MDLHNFFVELRRRNVYRAAAAYGVVAWLLVQIATQVFPFFDIPNTTVRLVILSLLVGFPIAMIVSWIFEWTPAGLKRTADVPDPEPVHHRTGRKLDFVIIGALLVVIGVLAWQRLTPPPEKSIAVLPFENLSTEKENLFLVEGLQDNLLTSLTKIKDLKVISRTSVMKYREVAARNIQEIGKTLGAANILEGSVRRVGDRIAVNVQLIDARSDRHRWAERYDRKISDAVGLEGELAVEIADALRATLTADEKSRVERKPTQNADAYVLYLRGLQYLRNPDSLLQNLRIADQLLSEAIQRDPQFALAHAALSITSSTVFHFHEPLDTWREKARQEADLALKLQPNLSEGLYALGLCLYWIDSDYQGASRELSRAAALAPGDADIQLFAAAILRREGKWPEALATFERAQDLDPQNPNVIRNVFFTQTAMRQWAAAAQTIARFRAVSPDSLVAKIQSAYLAFQGYNDLTALRREVTDVPPGLDPDGIVTACRWEGAMIERDYYGATEILQASALTRMDYLLGGPAPKSFLEGCTALARGDATEAQKNFAEAVVDFEKGVETSPSNATSHANLGLCYAFMGRRGEAIREGARAVELKSESTDATDGVLMSCYLALIYARLGENDLALPLIERLLKTNGAVDSVCYSMTVNDLKYRWEWDPLRSDPRFRRLIEANPRSGAL